MFKKSDTLSMYEPSNLSPPNSCSPLNNETLKQTSLTNLLTNHHLNSLNSINSQTDLFKSTAGVCFNMSTTLSPTSSNSSCSTTAISPSTYNYNSYLPTFNSSVNDSSRTSNYFNDTSTGNTSEPQSHLSGHHLANNHNQYLENYSNSLISNHHNSPSLSSSSPSSVSSTFTNLHNHFSAHPNSTVNTAAHSLAAVHHNSTNHQQDLTNHSSLSNSISNSLSNSSVMHHLNNQNSSSFPFNHQHQSNHQLNLSSFNHLHHHSNHYHHNLDTTDLTSSSTATALTAPVNNPMSIYYNSLNNGDSMLTNTNSLTSLTNLTGLNSNANSINNNALALNTNVDYFGKTIDSFINSNKFNKTIDRGK